MFDENTRDRELDRISYAAYTSHKINSTLPGT
jgi:hypothetical protein